MKRFFKIILVVLLVLAGEAYPVAGNASGVSSGVGPGLSLPDVGLPGIGGPTLASAKLCEIKQLFCGKTALTIISFSVFMMGIMLLNHKLQWQTALMMITGIIVFYNADKVALLFNNNILVLPGNCSCSK